MGIYKHHYIRQPFIKDSRAMGKGHSGVKAQAFLFRKELLSNRYDKGVLFTELKNKLDTYQVLQQLDGTINGSQDLQRYVYGNPLPKTYETIRRAPLLLNSDDLIRELNWASNAIIRYSETVNSFLKLKADFDNEMVLGQFEKAESTLDYIEKNICTSLWSLSSRFVVNELRHGIAHNKSLLSSLNRSDCDALVGILAGFFSRRAEQKISAAKYDYDFTKFLTSIADRMPLLVEPLAFNLNYNLVTRYNNLSGVINYSHQSAITDRYLSLIRVIQTIISESDNRDANILKIVNRLARHIQDHSLDLVCAYFNPKFDLSHDSLSGEILAITDSYTNGDYASSADASKLALAKHPTCFELYDIYIRSIIELNINPSLSDGEPSPKNQILRHLFEVYRKSPEFKSSLSALAKLAQTFFDANWSYQLNEVVNAYSSRTRTNYRRLSLLNSSTVTSNFASAYPISVDSLEFIRNIKTSHKESSTLAFWTDIYLNIVTKNIKPLGANASEIRKAKYLAWMHSQTGNFKAAADEYKALLASNPNLPRTSPFIYEEVIVHLFHTLVQLKRYSDVSELVVENYLINPYFVYRMPLSVVTEEAVKRPTEEMKRSISTSILLDIYYSQYERSIKNRKGNLENLYYAMDDFLAAYGADKPSTLSVDELHIPTGKLVYFLDKVCIPDVMDSLLCFDGSEDVEKERIQICRLLVEIDPENARRYTDEISKITQRSMVRKGIQQFDESKIYVDIAGLSKSLEASLKESFNRYLDVSSLSLKGITFIDTTDDLFSTYTISVINDDSGKLQRVVLMANGKIAAFKEMFLEVRDRFISSNEFGLDSYLSVRIRHGTLIGQIRRQFESAHLITQKDKETEEYYENSYWKERLKSISPDRMSQLQNELRNFSRRIDNITRVLNNEWIQVKTEKKNQNGLFDFSYTDGQIQLLFASKFTAISTYEEFIESSFSELWERTEHSLTAIRQEISQRLKQQLVEAIDTLYLGLAQIMDREMLATINSSISTCRTNIQNELERIERWFNLPSNTNFLDFNLELVTEIGLEILNNVYPQHTFSPTINIYSDLGTHGKYLPYFVDIFFIILDNIAKHSASGTEVIPYTIEATYSSTSFSATVTNKVPMSTNLDETRQKLKAIAASLRSEKQLETVKQEGGTGFIKINKILKYDLNRTRYSVIPYIGPDRTFVVKIEFESKGLAT